MLGLRGGEKTLFEMHSISNLFLKISKTGHSVTFKLSDQHKAGRDSKLIFSGPAVAIETEHIDQVLENFSAFAQARAHLANSEDVYL